MIAVLFLTVSELWEIPVALFLSERFGMIVNLFVCLFITVKMCIRDSRGFGQEIVEDLAKYSSVPVWNGLTNEYHPTQMLADMLTIKEKLGRLKGVKFVYMGDARYNMGNSLMIVCAK